MFSCEFCKVFKSTFFTEHLRTIASTLMYLHDGFYFSRDKDTRKRQPEELLNASNGFGHDNNKGENFWEALQNTE